MKKFILSKIIIFVVSAIMAITMSCSKDPENAISGVSSSQVKLSQGLDVNYYYELGEGHNQELEILEKMNIPNDATYQEVLQKLLQYHGITTCNKDLEKTPEEYESFEEFGHSKNFSVVALNYCRNLDSFPYSICLAVFEDPDAFIAVCYSYATDKMHAVYNDYTTGLLSEKEKESLLILLGVYVKSLEYWRLYEEKTLLSKKQQIPDYGSMAIAFQDACAYTSYYNEKIDLINTGIGDYRDERL